MLWMLGLACAPGKIEVGSGSDELHTALYVTIPDEGDQRRAALLLSNSALSCDAGALGVVDAEEPEERDTAWWDTGPSLDQDLTDRLRLSDELTIALTRENSRLVLVELLSFRQEDLKGYYPLDAEASPSMLDDLNPRVGVGTYYGVNEAEAVLDEGLLRSYEVTDLDFARNIGAPGMVDITRTRDGEIWGRFNMNSVNVSGRFHAKQCEVAYEDSVFRVLEDLLSTNLF